MNSTKSWETLTRPREASQLLAKLVTNEQDVTEWTKIAAGVYGTFGDSLPVEGLIEAANETARTGTVTGVLADAINWAAKRAKPSASR